MKAKLRSSMRAGLFALIMGIFILSVVFIRQSVRNLPSVSTLERYVPPLATKVLDAYGLSVGEFYTERRIRVPLVKIPIDLRQAVMATEDADFYDHWGIALGGIVRAFLANLKAGRVVQGGSTLTQQLAKTIFLTRQKTFIRKFRELLLTIQIEKRYSKDEILELYLNQIYFGAGAYGVEAAAQLYFDKHTEEMNLGECATIAGLIRSPNRYSPLRHPDRAIKRRAHVLGRMRHQEFISELEEKEANESPIIPEDLNLKKRQAHYFLEEIKKSLGPRYGSKVVQEGGLVIQSTLDLKMQQAAEEVLEKHLSDYDLTHGTATLAEYNEDLLTVAELRHGYLLEGSSLTIVELLQGTTNEIVISTIPPSIQGSLIAMDVHTGAIRAMVGGRDFFESQFNRALQAKRQPGSSFKPFVWAAALENRFTASTLIDDFPLVYIDMDSDPTLLAETTSYSDTWLAILDNLRMTQEEFDEIENELEQKELLKRYWRPQNYDARYYGPMTLRQGLQKSRNLISIRIADSIGPRAIVRMAKDTGIKSQMNPVLSLSLGTVVASLLEVVNAYGTFASGGLHAQSYFIERVTDRRGKIVEEFSPVVTKNLNPQTAFLITNLLQGVVNHGTGWYAKRLRRSLGGKTGTTQDQRDLLFIGFSPDLVAGVWIGYDDFRPLKSGLSASKIAVPLWTDFMREALKNYPPKEFPIPPHIEFAKVDAQTGFLALPTCPKVVLEAFKEGTVPNEFCPYDHEEEEKETEKKE